MTYRNNTGLPSVTTIIGPYIDRRWFTQEHSDRGTAIHDCCHLYLAGEWCIPTLPVEWRGYFDSFKRWADQVKPSPTLMEERLKDSNMGFCGQPDFIGRLAGSDDVILLDWKTSQAYQKWFSIQGEAYRHLAGVDKGLETVRSGSVRLKADGSGCLVNYADNSALNIFWGLLNAHKFFNERM